MTVTGRACGILWEKLNSLRYDHATSISAELQSLQRHAAHMHDGQLTVLAATLKETDANIHTIRWHFASVAMLTK